MIKEEEKEERDRGQGREIDDIAAEAVTREEEAGAGDT